MRTWFDLQAWRSDAAKHDWEERRALVQGGADRTVCLSELVGATVEVIHDWLVCHRAAPRSVSECIHIFDSRPIHYALPTAQ
jgi:hypothetical protein